MKVTIQSPEELGLALRAVRKHSRVRLEDLAQTVGVSKQTATNVEQGKAKLGTMLEFLREMGIVVSVEIPESALSTLDRLRQLAAAHGADVERDGD
jgi:DNA-binding XRE family transcriptional regulator